MEDFTNAVRAELGLDPYTAEDVNRAGTTYMETLTKQMNDYIKETQEEARRYGFLEPCSRTWCSMASMSWESMTVDCEVR